MRHFFRVLRDDTAGIIRRRIIGIYTLLLAINVSP